jgi:hypothetical protein
VNDPNALLMESGIPAVAFEAKGDVVCGEIIRVAASQQTDFTTKAPLFYEDGKPRMQIVVTLRCREGDYTPNGPTDDGMRKLYIKGQMQVAVRDAVVAARADGLAEGGTLAVKWDDEKPPEKRGHHPQKLYVAQYKPPAPANAVTDLLGTNGSAARTDASVTAPAAEAPAPTTGTDLI